jgi:hypothetical protein
LLRVLLQKKIEQQVLIDRIEQAPKLDSRIWLMAKAAVYRKR